MEGVVCSFILDLGECLNASSVENEVYAVNMSMTFNLDYISVFFM